MQKDELKDFIDFIYEDNKVSNVELQFIRDVADEKIEMLFEQFGENNNLSAFQKSMDVSVQLMQNAFFDIKKKEGTEDGKREVKEVFEFQIAYLVANYNRFFSLL
ncbi:hypothetical protein [Proteus sp. PR00174]|uniref:hypothetical protein n=1 Tax=Proteus sp. PR00174 TaxID=2794024 RepID=UPI001E31B7D5|nr:hypothetical protein [Proteus sp. PR00174]